MSDEVLRRHKAVRVNDNVARERGEALVNLLGLKSKHENGWYPTAFGNKTAEGLARSALSVLLDEGFPDE